MSTVKNIRKELGLTQHGLATYLGVSRSMISKAEASVCSLSTGALWKLAKLQSTFHTAKEPVINLKSDDAAKTLVTKQYIERLQICEYDIQILGRKLAMMKKAYQQCHSLNHLFEVVSIDQAYDSWTETNKYSSNKKLHANGQTAQESLRKKLFLLTAEIAYIKRFLRNSKTESIFNHF